MLLNGISNLVLNSNNISEISCGRSREEINKDWIWLTRNLIPVLGKFAHSTIVITLFT